MPKHQRIAAYMACCRQVSASQNLQAQSGYGLLEFGLIQPGIGADHYEVLFIDWDQRHLSAGEQFRTTYINRSAMYPASAVIANWLVHILPIENVMIPPHVLAESSRCTADYKDRLLIHIPFIWMPAR
jgi:hypothetical protein